MGKIRSFISKNKKSLAIGAGVVAGGALLGLGAKKFLGRRGGGASGARRSSSVARLKNQVMRMQLKIKKKQLQRKLFKEEMRV